MRPVPIFSFYLLVLINHLTRFNCGYVAYKERINPVLFIDDKINCILPKQHSTCMQGENMRKQLHKRELILANIIDIIIHRQFLSRILLLPSNLKTVDNYWGCSYVYILAVVYFSI